MRNTDRRNTNIFKRTLPAILLIGSLTTTGCGMGGQGAADVSQSSDNPQQGQGQQQNKSSATDKVSYPEVKTMVLDILHSKEGMNTLKDTMSSPEFKKLSAVSEADVKAAVEKTINQGQNHSFLMQQMKDTKFADALVKASSTQMMDIQRQLMKDPEYQQQLVTLMKSPEFQKSQFELLQSPEYRKEIMKIMTEALQQPTFRLLFMDSMKEAVKQAGGGQKQEIGKDKGKKEGSSGGGSSSGGGGGGGEGEGGSEGQ